MLKNIRIKQLSNTGDCLRWSGDGTLAIVAAEDVVILVPRFRSDGSTKRPHQFWNTQAKMRELIVAVMDDDVEPADSEVYSIGEEQGPGYAKEVSWSPMGVSRHRRCILAVLSTNHVVHIFAPEGHPGVDWRPLHNLGVMMEDYSGWPEEERDETTERVRRMNQRLRSRSRCISWSPACRVHGSSWGESLLAVANEHLEIVFFRITADTVEAVGHIQPFGGLEVANILGKRQTFLKGLTWSPWIDDKDENCWGPSCRKWEYMLADQSNIGHSFLAYSFSGKVYVSKLRLSFKGERLDLPQVTIQGKPMIVGKAMTEIHPVHCIAWAPEAIGGRVILAYAVQKRVSVVGFDLNGNKISSEDFKNEFIELLTGLCFAPAVSPYNCVIQLLSSQGRSHIIKYTLRTTSVTSSVSRVYDQAHLDTPEVPEPTATVEELRSISQHWSTALAEMKQDFMGEYDLNTATIRAYGLACSPLGGITVVAASFHPDDTPEYITAANEKMLLIFGTQEGARGSWDSHRFDKESKRIPDPYRMASEALLIEMMALGAPLVNQVESTVRTFPTPPLSVPGTLKNALLSPSLNAARYASLISHIYPNTIYATPPKIPDSVTIIGASVAAILSAMPYDTCGEAKRLLYSTACVGILGLYTSSAILELARSALLWLAANTPEDVCFDLEIGVIDMRLQPEDTGNRLAVDRGIVSSMESCLLCSHGMVWRDLHIAECTEGHRFSRCGKTWLPIVDPGDTVECGVCENVVIDKGYRKDRGLMANVQDTWDVCLRCGGRYWADGS